MTYTEQAIKIAIENKWKDWDYMPNIVIDTSDYVDFLKDWKPVEGTHLSYIILDPLFWQALGKGLGKNGQEVISTKGGYTYIVDRENLAEVTLDWTWELQKGYLRGTKKGTKGKVRAWMHRIVLGRPIGADEVVDHINGNRLDNRVANLRIVDAKKNALNKKTTSRGKYRGVYYHKDKDSWMATAQLDGKIYYNGYHKDKDVAAEKAEELRKRLYGEYHNGAPVEWWRTEMHLFIDHLADGKDIESFFEQLIK